MKIIGRSNFDDEMVDDILVCDNITNRTSGETMVIALNNIYSDQYSRYFYELKEDDYELYKWEP